MPDDIPFHITSFLDAPNLEQLSIVSKQLQALAKEHFTLNRNIWEQTLFSYFSQTDLTNSNPRKDYIKLYYASCDARVRKIYSRCCNAIVLLNAISHTWKLVEWKIRMNLIRDEVHVVLQKSGITSDGINEFLNFINFHVFFENGPVFEAYIQNCIEKLKIQLLNSTEDLVPTHLSEAAYDMKILVDDTYACVCGIVPLIAFGVIFFGMEIVEAAPEPQDSSLIITIIKSGAIVGTLMTSLFLQSLGGFDLQFKSIFFMNACVGCYSILNKIRPSITKKVSRLILNKMDVGVEETYSLYRKCSSFAKKIFEAIDAA